MCCSSIFNFSPLSERMMHMLGSLIWQEMFLATPVVPKLDPSDDDGSCAELSLWLLWQLLFWESVWKWMMIHLIWNALVWWCLSDCCSLHVSSLRHCQSHSAPSPSWNKKATRETDENPVQWFEENQKNINRKSPTPSPPTPNAWCSLVMHCR